MLTDNIILNETILMVCAYMFARSIVNKTWAFLVIAVVGVAQAMYALLQCCGFVEGGHVIFDITGFMGNPGQLGGFQAIALMSLLVIYEKGRNRHEKVIWALSVTLILSSLVLADSRAATLASVVGVIVLTYQHWVGFMGRYKWMWAVVICVILIILFLLYWYRPDSANSRLLIWRVCVDMFADRPLLGFGTGGFNKNYMSYLSKFLSTHPDHVLSSYAADTSYPYNEFIHILIDYGLIGFMLFVAFVVCTIKGATKKRVIAPFVTFLTFALFSYPSYKLALAFLFPLLSGVSCSPPVSVSKRRAVTVLSFAIIGICSANLLYGRYKFKNIVNEIYTGEATAENIDFVNRFFKKNHAILSVNTMYATLITHGMYSFSEQNIPLIFPSSDSWCAIGNYYLGKGEYAIAERYFSQASQMNPLLVKPKYFLWNIYILQNREEEAVILANDILHLKVKVENTYTLRIKSEMRKYLSKTI